MWFKWADIMNTLIRVIHQSEPNQIRLNCKMRFFSILVWFMVWFEESQNGSRFGSIGRTKPNYLNPNQIAFNWKIKKKAIFFSLYTRYCIFPIYLFCCFYSFLISLLSSTVNLFSFTFVSHLSSRVVHF